MGPLGNRKSKTLGRIITDQHNAETAITRLREGPKGGKDAWHITEIGDGCGGLTHRRRNYSGSSKFGQRSLGRRLAWRRLARRRMARWRLGRWRLLARPLLRWLRKRTQRDEAQTESKQYFHNFGGVGFSARYISLIPKGLDLSRAKVFTFLRDAPLWANVT